MTDEEAHANALSDPVNPPLSEEQLARMKRMPPVRVLRYQMKLSQDEFATRFGIPLETLLGWERGLAQPDETASTYLRVIASEPEAVARALARPTAA